MPSPKDPRCFGTVVADALKQRRVSRAAFARQVGMPDIRIYALINGQTHWLTADREAAIELALDLPRGIGRELHTQHVERMARVRAATLTEGGRLYAPRGRGWRKGMGAKP